MHISSLVQSYRLPGYGSRFLVTMRRRETSDRFRASMPLPPDRPLPRPARAGRSKPCWRNRRWTGPWLRRSARRCCVERRATADRRGWRLRKTAGQAGPFAAPHPCLAPPPTRTALMLGLAPTERRGFTVERRIAVDDGLTLSVRDVRPRDDGGRLPVICLPGLSRNSRDFEPLARLLVADGDAPRRVVSIDSRGRGGSDWDPDPARYNACGGGGRCRHRARRTGHRPCHRLRHFPRRAPRASSAGARAGPAGRAVLNDIGR